MGAEVVLLPLLAAMTKLIYCVAALIFVRGTLLWLDRSMNIGFFKSMEDASPEARMAYFAVRFAATCFLFGTILSY